MYRHFSNWLLSALQTWFGFRTKLITYVMIFILLNVQKGMIRHIDCLDEMFTVLRFVGPHGDRSDRWVVSRSCVCVMYTCVWVLVPPHVYY